MQSIKQEPMEERRQRMSSCDRGIKAIWDEKNTKFWKCVWNQNTVLEGKNKLQKRGIKKIKTKL